MGKRIVEPWIKLGTLMSKVGRANIEAEKGRGIPVSPHPTGTSTLILDSYSKLFHKKHSATPYIAMIGSLSNNELLLSFPRTMTQLEITDIIRTRTMFDEVLIKPTIENKARLFKLMYNNSNPIVHRLYNDYKTDIRSQIKSLNPQSPDFQMKQEFLLKREKDFEAFAESKFDQFLSDSNLQEINTAGLTQKKIAIFPHDPKNPEHQNVHVEAKGLAHARDKNPTVTEFNIGLSSSKEDQPGCCAGCSAEFNTLEEKYGLIINRTTDFPYNFPPGTYVPSANVTRDPVVSSKFIEKIMDNVREQHPELVKKFQDIDTQLRSQPEAEMIQQQFIREKIPPPPPPSYKSPNSNNKGPTR